MKLMLVLSLTIFTSTAIWSSETWEETRVEHDKERNRIRAIHQLFRRSTQPSYKNGIWETTTTVSKQLDTGNVYCDARVILWNGPNAVVNNMSIPSDTVAAKLKDIIEEEISGQNIKGDPQ